MVAITHPQLRPTTATAPGRARRPLPAGGPGRAGRPALALVPPAGRHATGAGRRLATTLAAALLALVVVLAGAYLVRTPVATPTAGGTTHVVAEGETMWSIAVDHAPAGEAAGYVEALVAANGTAQVAPGQAITLPRP